MTTKIDQKSYLQKYLGGPSEKKKKKKVIKGKGFKIIDDDLDLTKLRALNGDELDILDEGEDAPQIAGIIDDRPEELKKLDQLNTTSKWKVINQDDGFSSKLQIQEIKKDIKEVEKENEIIFGKMYSDSEDEQKNDSDQSPPKKSQNDIKSRKKQDNDSDASPPRKHKRKHESDMLPRKQKNAIRRQNNSDSDASPPRRRDASQRKAGNKNYDSDLSPPRKLESKPKERKSKKPSRWGDADEKQIADPSPKISKNQRCQSPRKKRSSSSDLSPPRQSQTLGKNYDSDSPPRKSRKASPIKQKRRRDSDISSHRKRNHSPDVHKSDKYRNNNRDNDKNNRQRNYRHDNKYDEKNKNYDAHKSNRRDYDSDLSPPRRKIQKSDSPSRNIYKKDSSENRNKRKHSVSISPNREDRSLEKNRYKRSSNSPPPSNKKMAKTLEGKMAGLQNAVQLREENNALRKREEEAFKRMTDDVSGRNAQVVSRKSKRQTSEERQKLKDKAERQKELDEKYKKWSKGVKQMEAQEARVQEFLHEASKPLARHKDDKDLEDRLREVERDGDPMLQYMRQKKRERGELGPEKPSYKGSFPPNRFNIRPGYRWDGVDRSNGYEKKYFEQQSKRKAQEEEAYKWSTEDL